ncbi:MAG: ribosome small subunit-dependent GTPase A [FCB group bacterium]|nr:ribosome small subunit-dependent GTPase A [FCB group bacterium]
MNDFEKGIVVATRGRLFEVCAQNGTHFKCEIRKKVKIETKNITPVAVGDNVLFSRNTGNQGIIEKVLERHSLFARPAKGKDNVLQVIAANLDLLAIVASVDSPPLKTGLIDRFIIVAQIGEMTPFIIMNKIDLKPPEDLEEIIVAYQSLNIDVLVTSALAGKGIKELGKYLQKHRSLMVGHSGVGKSSILNKLIPDLNIKTLPISKYTNKGKHSTTSIELYELPSGGFVADSPGLKILNLWNIDKEKLPAYFSEFEKYQDKCRFSPCSHTHEPDCAVKEAVKKGHIYQFRYDNYLAIAHSL